MNIEPDIGTVGLLGTREVAPSITTNYTLTAKNKGQEKIASVKLIVKGKNEGNQVTNDVVDGIAAKFDVPMLPDVKVEPDQKQNVIYRTLPAAVGNGNPDGSAIVPNSDSQQNAAVQPAQMAAEPSDTFESTVIDQSGMRQNAIVVPVSAIMPDTAAKHDSVSELVVSKATAPKCNASEPIAHVESGLAEFSTIDEAHAIATYSNESEPGANSILDTGSDDSGVTEPKVSKVITAEDWGHLKNILGSENDFASSVPIYTKLGDTRHTPANGPDFQDPAVSDPGLEGSDYLNSDI